MDFPDCETAGYRPPVIHASASGFSIFLLCFTSVNKADDDVEVALCLNYNRMSVRNFASPCSQSAVPNHTHSNTGAVTVSLAQPSNPPAQQLKTKPKKSASDVRSWSFCRRRLEILTLTLTASVFVYTASTNIYIHTHTCWDGDCSWKGTDRSKPPYPKQNGCRRNFRLLSCLRSLPTIPRAVQSGKKGGGRGRE